MYFIHQSWYISFHKEYIPLSTHQYQSFSHCVSLWCFIALQLHVSRHCLAYSFWDYFFHNTYNFGCRWTRVAIITSTEEIWRSTAETTQHLLQNQGKVVLFRSIEPIHYESEVCISNNIILHFYLEMVLFISIMGMLLKQNILQVVCHPHWSFISRVNIASRTLLILKRMLRLEIIA